MSSLGMTIQNTQSTAGNTIATDPAGYVGTTTTTVATGPTGGSGDVYVTFAWVDTPVYPNYIRVFKKSNSVLVPWGLGTYDVPYQVKNASAKWQKFLTIGPIRLNGDSETVEISKELDDTNLRYSVEQGNYQ